jgi:hypothetical protein
MGGKIAESKQGGFWFDGSFHFLSPKHCAKGKPARNQGMADEQGIRAQSPWWARVAVV